MSFILPTTGPAGLATGVGVGVVTSSSQNLLSAART